MLRDSLASIHKAAAVLVLALAAGAPGTAHAATITVSSVADDSATNGNCTLREAITAANTNAAVDACTAGQAAPTQDLIDFALGAGTPTIVISSGLGALPTIAERVTIDGSTGGATRVRLDGGSFGVGVDGLRVTASNVILRKLVLSRFSGDGVEINGSGASNNRVEGSFIGTDAAGAVDQGNGKDGVLITGGATLNVIGGDTLGQRNVISGNNGHGVEITGTTSTTNTLKVNYIGVDAAGLARLWNEGHGIRVLDAAQNTLGCTSPFPCLVVGGRPSGPPYPDLSLVRIEGGQAVSNSVLGGYLGVGSDGNTPVGSFGGAFESAAVKVAGSSPGFASGTVIGCTSITPCNVISANDPTQLGLYDVADVKVVGNFIGLNAAGTASLMPGGFSPDGITADTCTRCQIGGTAAGSRNVVSGSSSQIRLTAAQTTTVEGNYVGPDASGTSPILSNYGIFLDASTNITVGGTTAAARNVISGIGGLTPDLGDGVVVTGCDRCRVLGNYIGTDRTGTFACANVRGIGVSVDLLKDVTISGNLLAGNANQAIELDDSGFVTVTGNTIGLAADGTTAIPNGDGIVLTYGMDHAQIGGPLASERNIIAGNSGNGIRFDGFDVVSQNRVQGNYIGVLGDGVTARGNLRDGIVFVTEDSISPTVELNTVGGGAVGEGNVISGNGLDGLRFMGSGVHDNVVAGNKIGVGADGLTALPNGRNGVELTSGTYCVDPPACTISYLANAAGPQRIGSDSDGVNDDAEANRIANNGGDGVKVEAGAVHTTIQRNQIYANGCVTCTTRLAIDLQSGTAGANDGVNANDVDDVDSGSNDFMNFPVLGAGQWRATAGVTNTLVLTYSADVRAAECSVGSPCRVEFYFAGEAADPSGFGEGRSYLGADSISGDVAAKVVTLTVGSPATACGGRYCHGGDLLSATLTNNLGSTGEFAADVATSELVPAPGDCNADYVVSAADATAIVLEIFDGDGSSPWSVHLGTFLGHPVGCNPNGDAAVDAGDLSCVMRKLFGGPGASCGP